MLAKRTDIANKALNRLIKDLEQGAQVALLDASNTTEGRREYIHRVLQGLGIRVLFLECIYEHEEELVESHVRELRMTLPEYEALSDQEALEDFKRRIQNYLPSYRTMAEAGDQALSYIQIFNGGQRMVVNRVHGFLPSKILYYLMNIRPCRKSIYLVQPEAVQGDPGLLDTLLGRTGASLVWTDTATGPISCDRIVRRRAMLSRLSKGDCEGLDMAAIKERFPEDYRLHCLHPYSHRFHRAESYHDLVVRLESVIMEAEKETRDILVVADISVIRCIYAYFIGAYPFVIPSITFPPEADLVIKLEPKAYGCYETRLNGEALGLPEAFSIFRQYVDY